MPLFMFHGPPAPVDPAVSAVRDHVDEGPKSAEDLEAEGADGPDPDELAAAQQPVRKVYEHVRLK